MQTVRLGGLKAVVTGGDDGRGGGQGPAVVLLHGYGAPGDDLVDLARFLQVPKNVRFVFPEAPLSLQGGFGRAWWPLDMELFERRARGEHVDRTEDVPATLAEQRALLLGLVSELETRWSIGRDQIVLGGFSQGSMLACDAALHSDTPFAGLVLLSSTLIARPLWQERVASLRGVPVLMTHGHRDPLLAFSDAERLRDLLASGGADVTFVPFPGGHELPPIARDALTAFLERHPTRA